MTEFKQPFLLLHFLTKNFIEKNFPLCFNFIIFVHFTAEPHCFRFPDYHFLNNFTNITNLNFVTAKSIITLVCPIMHYLFFLNFIITASGLEKINFCLS